MRTSHLAGTVVLALSVFLSRGASAQDARFDDVILDASVEEGGVDADKMLQLWGKRLGVPLYADQQLAGTKLRMQGGPITWSAFKKVLDFYDIVIDQKNLAGVTILFAHLRRNFPCKLGPPFPVVSVDEAWKHPDEVVSCVMKIQHGAGNDIFATVRGLLVRDVNRIGNILYVRGPEALIIVDFGSNVDYYAKMIRALDIPEGNTRVFDLEHANAEDLAHILDPLGDMGTRVIAAPRTNQVVVRGHGPDVARLAGLVSKLDVAGGPARPRFRADAGIALWKIATAFAVVAFIGQTILLRRFQRRALLSKLAG
jgi:hypothetical protein